jgi:hypothetical protein
MPPKDGSGTGGEQGNRAQQSRDRVALFKELTDKIAAKLENIESYHR